MKLGFIADQHIANHKQHGGKLVAGINTRARLCLDTLGDAVGGANEAGVDHLFLSGDLFDNEHPTPQLLAAAQSALSGYGHEPGVTEVHVIPGNHDRVSGEPGDHALGPLLREVVYEKSSAVHLGNDIYAVVLPFMAEPAEVYIPRELARCIPSVGVRIVAVVVHVGIYDPSDTARYPYDVTACADAISLETIRALQKKYDIEYVCAGNWHEYRDFGDGVIQIGALCPTGWDNPSTGDAEPYGSLVIIDTDDASCHRLMIPGPRFFKADSVAELTEMLRSNLLEGGNTFFARVSCAPADIEKTRAGLEALGPQLAAYEIRVDQAAASATARMAARVASSQDVMRDAVAEFLGGIAAPPGCAVEAFRDDVASRVWAHLASSS